MEWWQWIVLGAGILAAETIIDSEFYLIFIGIAGIAVGLYDFIGIAAVDAGLHGFAPYSLPLWGQWLLFATLVGVGTVAFRRKLYERLRGNPPEIEGGVVGEIAVALEPIDAGKHGQVELRGATWTTKNTGNAPIPASGRARVHRCEGLTVHVQPER